MAVLPRVLFVCVENSNRSQMAEAFARIHGAGAVEAFSAGSRPSGRINPRAIAAMAELGYDLTTHRSTGLDEIPAGSYAALVTMGCGDACPWVPAALRVDWALPDPRDLEPAEFNAVRDEIEDRVVQLLATLPIRCPGCRATMTLDTREGVSIDRCLRCGGLWFDAQELDRCLMALYGDEASPPENRIPERGLSTRLCPRCHKCMKTAGWTELVLDRCLTCRGLFVEARELARMEREQPPHDAPTLEHELNNLMVSSGFTLLGAQTIVTIILRFLR